MHVVRELVGEHHLDLVVRILVEHRVGDQDPPRPPDAGERRIRLDVFAPSSHRNTPITRAPARVGQPLEALA